jgi:hypothetical protein
MMRFNIFSSLMIAGLLSGSLGAFAQDSSSAGLEHELLAHFAPTKFEKSKVVKAGTVLAVQKEGIGAISPNSGTLGMGRLGGSDLAYPNTYKSGTIRHDGKAVFLNSAGRIRDLEVNERVYILKVEVKDTSILIAIQSCGTCDPKLPDPEHVPARANVSFQLGKPYLSAASPAQVQEIIGHVFADAGTAPPSQAPVSDPAPVASPPTQPAAPLAPIPPPPPPADTPAAAPAPPTEVKIGQTPEQVTAALGQPQQIFNLGAKVVYKYKSLKVTFVNGKVSDVE